MKKKIYTMPQTVVVKVEVQSPIVTSQFDVTVNDPIDEVDAGDALSRRNNSIWDDQETMEQSETGL